MNDSLREYIKESNIFPITFDDALDSAFITILTQLSIPIKKIDDSLDFWDIRTIAKWGEWSKWELFEITEEEMKLLKNVRKTMKEFEKENEESLLDPSEWRFPPYLEDEFILSRTTREKLAFLLPHQQVSPRPTKTWIEVMEEIHSGEKLCQPRDDEAILRMEKFPEIDIALNLKLEIPQEAMTLIKEVMISNKSISKLDATSALLQTNEDDSDDEVESLYRIPESPRSGSPPIFSRRYNIDNLNETTTSTTTSSKEELQSILHTSLQNRSNTEPIISPRGNIIGMVEWNEYENIQPFPSSSPTARTINNEEAIQVIWSSPTIQSSPPSDYIIDVPIFPRVSQIFIKEEPIDNFFEILQPKMEEIDELESEAEDEIDELENDDYIPGFYQDLSNLIDPFPSLPLESSPTLSSEDTNLLLQSRLKIPSFPNFTSPLLLSPQSTLDLAPSSKTIWSFPSKPISTRTLSIELSWQAWSMRTDETIWNVFVEFGGENEMEKEAIVVQNRFIETLEEEIEDDDWKGEGDVTIQVTESEEEEEEDETITARSDSLIVLPSIESLSINEISIVDLVIRPTPILSEVNVSKDLTPSLLSLPESLQDSSPPPSSFVDIISTQFQVIDPVVPPLSSFDSEGSKTEVELEEEMVVVVPEEEERVHLSVEVEVEQVNIEVIDLISPSLSPSKDNTALILDQTSSSPLQPPPVQLLFQDTSELIIPKSLQYISEEITNFPTTSNLTWSNETSLARFLDSKGKGKLNRSTSNMNRNTSIPNKTTTSNRIILPQTTSVRSLPSLPFTIPSFHSSNISSVDIHKQTFRIIASHELLQMRSHYQSLKSFNIELVDRPPRYLKQSNTKNELLEPHLIITGNTCIVFFRLIKLVGNVFKKEEIDFIEQGDLNTIKTTTYKEEAIFTSLYRLSKSFQKVICCFEEFASTSSNTTTSSREFNYTKPVLEALQLLSNSIKEYLPSSSYQDEQIEIVISKDSTKSAEVVKKLLIHLEEGNNLHQDDRSWLTDDPTENELILLQLPQLNPFSACYILSKMDPNNSIEHFINMTDQIRFDLFSKVVGEKNLIEISNYLKENKKLQELEQQEQIRIQQEEEEVVEMKTFQETELEYQLEPLQASQQINYGQEGEEVHFSELFDYDTYDYDYR